MAQDDEIKSKSGAALQSSLLAYRTHSAIKLFADKYQKYRNKIITTTEKRAQGAQKNIQEPPKLRYFIVLYACVGLDLLGIVLLIIGLTGAGTVGEFLLSWLFITLPMNIFTRVMVGRKLKRMQKERKDLEKDVEALQKAFTLVRQKFLRLSRYALKASPQLAASVSRAGARIGSVSAKVTQTAPKIKSLGSVGKFFRSPFTKTTGESIPIVQVAPWWTLGIIFQYKEHKNEYEAGQAILAKYKEVAVNFVQTEDINFDAHVLAFQAESENTISDLASFETDYAEMPIDEFDEEYENPNIVRDIERADAGFEPAVRAPQERSTGPTPYRVRSMQDINPAVAA